MKSLTLLACGTICILGACTPPEIASRLDTQGALNSGFEPADAYGPEVAGMRADNDFMRFSTMSMALE